jgi:RNA:NAD 2'-phosphotransferase (TPT1/KptA family)
VATHQQQIRAISEQLKVPYLVHFTRAQNLESIITNGIYPVSRVNEVSAAPEINDLLRLDGRSDGT